MNLGITATRSGFTVRQAEVLLHILAHNPVEFIGHGDCVGGDADCDALAAALGVYRVVHPPDNPALRAFCLGREPGPYALGRYLPALPYKERNRAIVRSCAVLLALPATAREQRYGGTWGTVRVAQHLDHPRLVVTPDGTVLPANLPPHLLDLSGLKSLRRVATGRSS